MTGFIYAIQAGDAVKLGWTSDPLKRFSELSTGSPNPHKLLGVVPATKAQERELHLLLSGWRLRGEWFSIISKPVAHFISFLKPPGTPPKRDLLAGSRKLGEYLRVNGTNPNAFAPRIGVPPSTVHRWIHGDRRPSRESMIKIEAATAGQVKVGDFFPNAGPAE